MEMAAETGVRCLPSNVWTDDRNFTNDALARLCELARPPGIPVNMEFVIWSSIKDMMECAAIINDTGCTNAIFMT